MRNRIVMAPRKLYHARLSSRQRRTSRMAAGSHGPSDMLPQTRRFASREKVARRFHTAADGPRYTVVATVEAQVMRMLAPMKEFIL
jgi:hypothetical protein